MNTSKTRYLQLGDLILMEYQLSETVDNSNSVEKGDTLIHTMLMDGHHAVFSPANNEFMISEDTRKAKRLALYPSQNKESITTVNTINHLGIPKDRKATYWYTFLDNTYDFTTASNISDTLDPASDVKVLNYAQYCKNPDKDPSGEIFKTCISDSGFRYDTLRLYFVTGYDFSGIFGIDIRLYVERNDNSYMDICNFFMTNSTAMTLVKYINNGSPLMFNNKLYDRYIDIKVPSIYDIQLLDDDPSIGTSFRDEMNIKTNAPIHINAISISESDYETESVIINNGRNDITDQLRAENPQILNKYANCTFVKTSSINGSIPTQELVSDNLGAYIGVSENYPCIEFYGTWKNNPLTYDIVYGFNRNIYLYNRKYITSKTGYEVSEDYEPRMNNMKWLMMHEIRCCFIDEDDKIIKEENYKMSQTFEKVRDISEEKFMYRPVFFDSDKFSEVESVIIEYSARLINTEDRVMFLKSASLSLNRQEDPDIINSFIPAMAKIDASCLTTYSVYNKIIESTQSFNNPSANIGKVKYVKMFYNSTDVIFEDIDGISYADNNYVLKLSNVSKNYKFIFKKKNLDGNFSFMDLSDGYYKLYAKNSNGESVIIEPTYSSNMNMLLGELEFSISSSDITKLESFNESERKMSIVMYNADNSISSLYDFYFTF